MTELTSAKWSDLGVRTLSAVVLIPLVLLDVWVGGAIFTCFIVALGMVMANEWVKINFGINKLQLLLHCLAATSLIMGAIQFSLGALLVLTLISIWMQRKEGLNF